MSNKENIHSVRQSLTGGLKPGFMCNTHNSRNKIVIKKLGGDQTSPKKKLPSPPLVKRPANFKPPSRKILKELEEEEIVIYQDNTSPLLGSVILEEVEEVEEVKDISIQTEKEVCVSSETQTDNFTFDLELDLENTRKKYKSCVDKNQRLVNYIYTLKEKNKKLSKLLNEKKDEILSFDIILQEQITCNKHIVEDNLEIKDRRESSDFKLLILKRKYEELNEKYKESLKDISELRTESILHEIQRISFTSSISLASLPTISSESSSTNEKTCSICYNVPETGWSVYTGCGHTYCRNCIRNISITSCPTCRSSNLAFIDIY
jgi:hypothetical protein